MRLCHARAARSQTTPTTSQNAARVRYHSAAEMQDGRGRRLALCRPDGAGLGVCAARHPAAVGVGRSMLRLRDLRVSDLCSRLGLRRRFRSPLTAPGLACIVHPQAGWCRRQGRVQMKTRLQLLVLLCLLVIAPGIRGQEETDREQYGRDIVVPAGETAGDLLCYYCSIQGDGASAGSPAGRLRRHEAGARWIFPPS